MSIQPFSSRVRTFFTLWSGQLVSLVGSQLTGFALGVWTYDTTHSVLWLALTQVALHAPIVLLSPLAGVLADKWNRRTAMIVSDFGAGLAVFTTAALFLSGHLQPWMVIPLNFVMSSFNTLMWPSYTASVTLLVPKEQYGRASGLVQLGEALPQIAGPAIAGALYVAIRLGNMALIDGATYLFSVMLMLLLVRIPNPPHTEEGQRSMSGSVWEQMRFGWDYIIERKGLLALLLFYLSMNFIDGIISALFVPLVLDNWSADVLGYLSTLMGGGMLAGTLVMSAWGGTKRKINTLLGGALLGAVFLLGVGLRTSIPLLAVCGFGIMFSLPIINASSQAIWQSKVAADVQGRVFAVRRAIALSAQVLSPLLAAPLADRVFKPGMAEGGALAKIFGPIVGVGANHGIGVLISLLALLNLGVVLAACTWPRLRNVEADLPDHAALPSVATPAALVAD